MATFILTWDGRDAGYPAADLAADIAATATEGLAPRRWSVGSRKGGISRGDRVFLLRQGTERGIVASGRLTDGMVFEAQHWNEPAKTARYVDVEWDRVLPVVDRLAIAELLTQVPLHEWNSIFASGQELPASSAAVLDVVWASHLAGLPTVSSVWTMPVGETLGRQACMDQYGGAMYAGIQPSKTSPNVFVYSDPLAGGAYGYNYDGWSSNGSVFLYTGEGRKGHQRMRVGNAAILNYQATGRALRLFVADGTEPGSGAKIQRYIGQFQVSPRQPFVTAEAPDEDGNQRTVIVFRLRPVGDVLRGEADVSASGDAPETPQAEPVPVSAAVTPMEARTLCLSKRWAGSATPWPAPRRRSRPSGRLSSLPGTRRTSRPEAPPVSVTSCDHRVSSETSTPTYSTRPPMCSTKRRAWATREAVRMAVGQLLDYSRHVPTEPELAVLLPARPADDLLGLLARQGIRCIYEVLPAGFEQA